MGGARPAGGGTTGGVRRSGENKPQRNRRQKGGNPELLSGKAGRFSLTDGPRSDRM